MNSSVDLTKPHRRYNPLSGEYVLVSPQRAKRPWQGQVEPRRSDAMPAHDPACYLCPGNSRAGGQLNPQYADTYVFTNDFPALLPSQAVGSIEIHQLTRAIPVSGTSRVLCYSPIHNLTLPLMDLAALSRVVDAWCQQTQELGEQYKWVQVFQNQGEAMGASNPHPHGQIWALDQIPNEIEKEDRQQREYFSRTGRPLLLDYLEQEAASNARLVIESKHWLVIVPFWAIWPFETQVLPRRHVLRLGDLDIEEREDLAATLKQLGIKYDNLFETQFPYSMGWHGAPFTEVDHRHWQLHAHFYPPLLRSASVRKFMVGYEMLAEAQRDLTAEQAAQHLASMPLQHYSQAQL
jgi:UDPglucose--hexose-1-phosphate uridylyltransferase